MKPEWQEILRRVQAGEISAEEGARLMSQLEGTAGGGAQPAAPAAADPSWAETQSADAAGPTDPQPEVAQVEVLPPEGDTSNLAHWRNWWLIPFWAGLGIFILSAVLMAWGYNSERFFWFYCSWLPLLLGLTVLVLSAWSRQARWLHLRVRQPAGQSGERPQRIAISMPIPTRLVGLVLRLLAPRIPQLRDQKFEAVGPLLDSLGKSREPLVVEVNEKDGQVVQIYIV